MIKCGDEGIHDFETVGQDMYFNKEGKALMKRQVKCIICDRKAQEYYLLLKRSEIKK